MANTFITTDLILKLMIKAFMNELQMGKKVDRQLDQNNIYAQKVGDTVKVRRPVYFEAQDGETISAFEDIQEGYVNVQLQYRKHVPMFIKSQDLTLKVEEFYKRYVMPAAQELAQQVESSIAAEYINIANFVGTPGTTPATFLALGSCKAKLNKLGTPMGDRYAFVDPDAELNLANGLQDVFPEDIARTAIEQASIGRYGGFEVFGNQSIKNHTVGVATGTPLVNGDTQNVTYEASKNTWSQSLITDGWTVDTTDILKAGDVITIAGVNSVNRKTREDTGDLAQFTVLADADSGSTTGPATLSISPPMITSGAYKTVTAAPADDAVITVKTGTGGTSYPQNLTFHKDAITLAFAKLEEPKEGAESSRMDYEGVSIRIIKQYDIINDRTICRLDVLYGIKTQNPDMACRLTG